MAEIPQKNIFETSCLLNKGIQDLLKGIIKIFLHKEDIITSTVSFSYPQRLSALYEMCLSSFSYKSMKDALKALLKGVRDILAFSNCIVFQITENRILEPLIIEGKDSTRLKEILDESQLDPFSGLIADVLSSGESMILDDTRNYTHKYFISGIEDLMQTQIILPIINLQTKKIDGIIHISSKEKKTFSVEHQTAMEIVARTVFRIFESYSN